MTKIFISGGPGSGKTTYAKKLSAEMNIPHFDLDDIKWEHGSFNRERPKEERLKLRDKILSENDSWIIEGVYVKDWIIPILEHADRIIILKPATWVRQYRIIKRSLKRIFHIEPNPYNENLITLFRLLIWSQGYNKNIPEMMKKVKKVNKTAEIIK